MTEKAFPRAKFDQRRSYVTLREFRLSGQMIAVGQLFDKALVDTRKLRQLYDARYLRMATTAEEPTSSRSRPRLREAAAQGCEVVSPFAGFIKQQIAKGFKGKLLNGIIRRYNFVMDENGDRQQVNYNDYPFQGIRDEFDAAYRQRAIIPETDVKILVILGLTSITPAQADKVYINGSWHEVRRVLAIDPAGATASLQAFAVASGQDVPYQDAQFSATFQITTVQDGAPPGSPGIPMDITSATFALWISTINADGSLGDNLVKLTTEPGAGLYITNSSQGLLKMVLTKTQTRNLPLGSLAFDCMRTDQIDPVNGQPEPQRYFGGVMYVLPAATQL